MKKWLEGFAKENGIDADKIKDGLALFNRKIEEATSTFKTQLQEAQAKEAKNGELFKAIEAKFGLADGADMLNGIDSFLASSGKTNEANLKSLQAQIDALKKGLEAEKMAKLTAVKKSELVKILDSITNLNPDHKEIVEIKLSNALKVADSGEVYFEKDGVKTTDIKSYIELFMKENERYAKPQGNAGAGSNAGYSNSSGGKSLKDLNLTEQMTLYKQNPELYAKLKENS